MRRTANAPYDLGITEVPGRVALQERLLQHFVVHVRVSFAHEHDVAQVQVATILVDLSYDAHGRPLQEDRRLIWLLFVRAPQHLQRGIGPMLDAGQPLVCMLGQVREGRAFEEGVDRRIRHVRYDGRRIGQAGRGDDDVLMWGRQAQERLPCCRVEVERMKVG